MADENTPPNMPLVQRDNVKRQIMRRDVRQREETNNETVSAKRMCYAGDINIEKVRTVSPTTLLKSMNILKRICEKKNAVINRLRVQIHRQKRKIKSLEALLNELRTKGFLSPTPSDIIKV